jgi:hypothetical protein
MPRAVPLPLREQMVQFRNQGHSLVEIAHMLEMSYRTVREIWRRYRQQGEAGLQIHYEHCGPRGIQFPVALHEAALSLKREHPRWGGGLIRVELAPLFPDQPLPAVRTLQRWFRAAGLQPAYPKLPPVPPEWGKEPHEVWQIDAKERMRLADKSGSSVLSATDEASGALVGVAVFSPVSLVAGVG